MKTATRWVPIVLSLAAAACGRTELEWEQKVREVEALSGRVAKQNAERARLDDDMARLQEENTTLKAELTARASTSRSTELAQLEQLRNERQVLEVNKTRADLLRTRLEPHAADGLTVSLRKGLLTITLPGSMAFEGKNADLSPRGRKALRAIAEAILADDRLLSRFFLVAGHEIPGKKEEGAIARSTARAAAVHNLLTSGKGGLPPARWSVAGRGVTDPAFTDAQPEDAERNQRVEIIMLPEPSELLTSATRLQEK